MSGPARESSRRVHGLASLYALGALTRQEQEAFDAHLEGCRASVDDVSSLLPVTRRLAAAAPACAPPAGMRARVLVAVTGSAPPPAADALAADTPTAFRPAAGAADLGAAATASFDFDAAEMDGPAADRASAAPPRRGRVVVLTLVAVASLAAAGWFGRQTVEQADRLRALQENLDAANAQALAAEQDTAAARAAAAAAQAHADLLAAPALGTVVLAGQPAAPDARGRFFLDGSGGGLFTASGLPPAADGRAYRLWLIPGGEPIGAGLLRVDPSGRVVAAVTVPDDVTTPPPVAVTLEPADGAATPGGDVYLLGRP